jgi:hypothetical protein
VNIGIFLKIEVCEEGSSFIRVNTVFIISHIAPQLVAAFDCEMCLLLNLHFVSGSSTVNKSKAIASNDVIDFVFFSGANWSEGDVIKYGEFLLAL